MASKTRKSVSRDTLVNLPVSAIKPNPNQPRKDLGDLKAWPLLLSSTAWHPSSSRTTATARTHYTPGSGVRAAPRRLDTWLPGRFAYFTTAQEAV